MVEGQLRCGWTDKREDPSGLETAGPCVVDANGLTRVTSLFDKE